jgi:hypothetical protein
LLGFSGDDVEKPCRVLGGEKARLVMAKMLFDPPNFLVSTSRRTIWTWRRRMLIAALAELRAPCCSFP